MFADCISLIGAVAICKSSVYFISSFALYSSSFRFRYEKNIKISDNLFNFIKCLWIICWNLLNVFNKYCLMPIWYVALCFELNWMHVMFHTVTTKNNDQHNRNKQLDRAAAAEKKNNLMRWFNGISDLVLPVSMYACN